MPTIPENQEQIYLALKELEADITYQPPNWMTRSQTYIDKIRACVVNCNRRKPVRVAPVTSDPVDYAKQIEILQTAQAHPDWPLRKIGAHCNVEGGRVSEILRGKRK